jgi:hypothetical protein
MRMDHSTVHMTTANQQATTNRYAILPEKTITVFGFLQTAFGFGLVTFEKWDQGHEVIYQSETTAVLIQYSSRHSYLHIMLYRLVEGRLVRNPLIPKPGSEVYGYPLNDLIDLTDPLERIRPMNDEQNSDQAATGECLTAYLCACARKLIFHGCEILTGDFRLIDQLQLK